tara:strand:- start:909 stop:1199 length:291 start_codon:yes stop_codon:yes gene_type:complete
MEKIKIEEKELTEIKELRQENSRMMMEFGKLKMDIILVGARLDEMVKREDDMTAKFKGNQTKEAKIADKLKKKYGDGTINLDEGVFTPLEGKDGES